MNAKRYRMWLLGILIAYTLLLLWRMLFYAYSDYIRQAEEVYRYSLIPFDTIQRYIVYGSSLDIRIVIYNLLGNIAVFVPIGYLIKAVMHKTKHSALLLSFAYIITLEFVQLITKRGVFDVDDIILNFLGCLIGSIAFMLCNEYLVTAVKNKFSK
ncbi:MAG: VanZ family protein [Bacillota bacterium]